MECLKICLLRTLSASLGKSDKNFRMFVRTLDILINMYKVGL